MKKSITIAVVICFIIVFAGIPAFGQSTKVAEPFNLDDERIHTNAWSLETSPVDLGYEVDENWIQIPAEFNFQTTSGVGVDSKDRVWVLHRGDGAPYVQCYSPEGKFMFAWDHLDIDAVHMIRFDSEGYVWVTDYPAHIIYKLDLDGKVLQVLGEKGVSGCNEKLFNQPSDIDFGPDGSMYVSDGYGNRRVVKLDKKGRFVKEWGKEGHGIGEFTLPHAITVSSDGMVLVSDRNMWRVQVFDGEGELKDAWSHIGRIYDLDEDSEGNFYCVDGYNGRVTKVDRNGEIIGWFGEPGEEGGQLYSGHSIAVDSKGNIIVGHLDGRVTRFKKR